MTIKKFFLFSAVFHLVLFLGMYFAPEPKIKKARDFVTSLVSPEELKKPEIQARPSLPPLRKSVTRPKAAPRYLPSPPLSKTAPARPPLSPEEPVVPGEGKEIGKPLPAGKRLQEGEAGKAGGGKEKDGLGDTRKSLTPEKPGFSVGRSLHDIAESVISKNSGGRGERAKEKDAITFDTEDYRYAGYMRHLRDKIESIWVYPPEAAAKGIYGDLWIQFTIKKDGRLGPIELVRTSGYKMLDDAAMKALKDGEPYWPLPDSWGKDSYTIKGHFVYVHGGYYIR